MKVRCPCGVVASVQPTHQGWTESWDPGGAFLCEEIAKRRKHPDKITGDEIHCERLSRLIQAEIHR